MKKLTTLFSLICFVVSFSFGQNVSVTTNNVSCNGGSDGSADASAFGGVAPYTYKWTNGSTLNTISGLSAGTYTVTVTDAIAGQALASVAITQPSASLSSTVTGTNVTCNALCDGSIDVTPSGGTSPYFYLWSPVAQTTKDITGICADIYTCNITDNNGCQAITNYAITQPTVLSVSYTSTNLSCNGVPIGMVMSTPSGGTPGYTYSWSNGATTQATTSISAGSYSVTVNDASGCTASTIIIITEPPALTISIYKTDASCGGASDGWASISGAGGTPGYSYKWDTNVTTQSITGLTTGTYTGSVSDANGCIIGTPIIIGTDSGGINSSINVSCNGLSDGSATASGCGTAPFSYIWNNGDTTASISGLAAGTYIVSITDSIGTTVVSSITITEPNALWSLLDSTSSIVVCNGNDGKIYGTVTGGTRPYNYAWSTGSTDSTIFGLTSGVYYLTVTDVNGCARVDSATLTDNPAIVVNTGITLSTCGNADGTAGVTVSGGTPPYYYKWSTGGTTQSINGLASGGYNVTITDANSCQVTTTFAVNDAGGPNAGISSTTNNTCNGASDGSATVTANGGTPPYIYRWNDGSSATTIDNLSQGTYTVTVTDANGCKSYATATITSATAIGIVTSSTDETCGGANNGTATATGSGGVSPYTYNWSNGTAGQTISDLIPMTYTVTVTDANGCISLGSIVINAGSGGTNLIISNVSCNGLNDGSLTSSGCGTAPFTYKWSTGATTSIITNLAAGTYGVTITDSLSVQTISTGIITEPSALNLGRASTHISCNLNNDGYAGVVATGGTGPYSYIWNTGGATNSLNGLSAGIYIATVSDANGCSDTVNVIILNPAVLTLSSVVTGGGCDSSGATIDLTVSGGTSPYTYSWSNGNTTEDLSVAFAGLHLIAVTDVNGCINSDTAIVTGTILNITLSSADISNCGSGDGTISANVSGGSSPYTYSWNNGSTASSMINIPAGNYTVIVNDSSGCGGQSSVNVNVSGCTGFITGQVFKDENGNGSKDTNEVGLNGVYVYVDSWNFWAVTDLNGKYAITVTGTGTYNVYVDAPSRYTCSGTSYSKMNITFPSSGSYSAVISSSDFYWEGPDFGLQDPVSQCGTISGHVFNDLNGNGVEDVGEPPLAGKWIYTSTYYWALTDANGDYSMEIPKNQTVTVHLYSSSSNYYYCSSSVLGNNILTQPSSPGYYTVTLTSSSPESIGNNFGMKLALTVDAGFYSFYMYYGDIPDYNFYAWMDFKIYAKTLTSCTLTVHKDPLVTLLNSSLTPVEVTDTTIQWIEEVDGYNFFHCMQMNYHLDASAVPGEELYWWGEIGCDLVDLCDYNNFKDARVTISNSTGKTSSAPATSDYNRMRLHHSGDQDTDIITKDDSTLSYEIGFQNITGDTAFSLVIRDTLSDYLNIESVSKPFSPFPHTFCIVEPNILSWEFDDIALPDSSADFLGSYGFVQYNINMNRDLAPGTQIDNKATVIYNYKKQVTTNTVTVTIEDTSIAIEEVELSKFGLSIYPNPNSGMFVVEIELQAKTDLQIQLINITGQIIYSESINAYSYKKDIDLSGYAKGIYALKVVSNGGVVCRKVVYR